MGCARVAWNLYNPSASLAPAFLSLLFGPTICLLMLGQVTVLVLLGITVFLTQVERRRDWLAGASLLLILLKPHIAIYFLLAVLLWTLQSKRWTILVSGALAVAAATVAALAINPHIFLQYLELVRQFAHETEIYPNLGGLLYTATGHHGWAVLPQLTGMVWLAFYWKRHGADWDWQTDGVLVLLVSVVCSYHSFPYDEILFLPALKAA
ncbi:MAG: glycosyltransferase 87 family protein [Candidatus Korobacteraceae bacterium]